MRPSLTPTYSQTEGLQIDDHKLDISCRVVKPPDHPFGDDLVLVNWGANRGTKYRTNRNSDPILVLDCTTGISCTVSAQFTSLPLDEAAASRVAFVIVSGADGQTGGNAS